MPYGNHTKKHIGKNKGGLMMVKLASEKYLELKKEVSRMASMANKRLRRLEKNELTDLPAMGSRCKQDILNRIKHSNSKGLRSAVQDGSR
jgi:hypothetical protein